MCKLCHISYEFNKIDMFPCLEYIAFKDNDMLHYKGSSIDKIGNSIDKLIQLGTINHVYN